jgi:hypothetical protein
MPTEEDDRRRKLAVVAVELGAEVARLTAASVDQAKALGALTVEVEKKNWMTTIKIRWMAALVVLDVLLSGGVTYGLFQISKIVNDAFCPLMAVFVGSYDPNSRPAGPGRIAYEDAFSQMRHIFGPVLECPPVVVPPRTDLTPPK